MQARISQPAKSAMQSAPSAKRWLLELLPPPKARFQEPHRGYTVATDMAAEVRLYFDTSQEAVKFAQNNGYIYEVLAPQKPKLIKQQYADNFK